MNTSETLLEIRNLEVVRPDGSLMLRVPELRLAAGQWLVVSGTSGSGKSTLLRIVAGLLARQSSRAHGGVRRAPRLRWDGEIFLEGTRQRSATIQEYRRRVVWIPQRPVLEPGKASVSIESLADYHFSGVTSREEAVAQAGAILAELGLDETILSRNTVELSGGEASRVALSRALLLHRRLLLLDEPGAALDAETSRIAANVVRRRMDTAAALIVSHDDNWTVPGSRRAKLNGTTLEVCA